MVLLRDSKRFMELFPKPVTDMIEAARDFDTLTVIGTQLNAGKVIPLIELNTALSKFTAANVVLPTAITRRKELHDVCSHGKVVWQQQIVSHISKMQKVDGTANSFQKKYGAIVGSIDKWHFDSCPWVSTADGDKENVDPDVSTMAKNIEVYSGQTGTWTQIVGRLSSDSAWLPLNFSSQLKDASEATDVAIKSVHLAPKILACNVLVSVILRASGQKNGDAEAATKQPMKFVNSVLGVATDSLPDELKKRLSTLTASPSTSAGSASFSLIIFIIINFNSGVLGRLT